MAPAASKLAARSFRGGRGRSISDDDRLSALPDELLLRVLSFLRARHAVQTSVLATRYVDLWRSVPGIILDANHFSKWPHEPWSEASAKMQAFAKKLLRLHDARCLETFRLTAYYGDHDSLSHVVDTWIRRAIFRPANPLVLEVQVIYCGGREFYLFPSIPRRGLADSNPCRRLKRLKLMGVSLDKSFAERFHSWWPQLEDLVLMQCYIGFCGIRSDGLKNLAIQYCNSPRADVFVIRAPALASLSLSFHNNESYRDGVSLHVGDRIVRASIHLLGGREFSPRCQAMMLASLFDVKCLEMQHFHAMVVLDDELFDILPMFTNMRTLTLGSSFVNSSVMSCVNNFKALGRFLQKAPNMETLILEDCDVAPTVELAEYPALENLRTLILDTCTLHDNFGLLHHCLRNSPNLEKLIVKYCQVSGGSTRGEGKAKPKETEALNMVPLHCPKLKFTELKHRRNDANIAVMQSLLLNISAPNNSIKLTNTKYHRS